MDSSSSRTKCITERLKTSQRQGREYRVSPSRTQARRLLVMTLRTDKRRRACARQGLTRYSHPCRWLVFKRSVIHFVREDDESMKPPPKVKTPAQYIASLPADRAKTIATVRALVNKHIPRGYNECLVWGTIGWTIPLSRYPDTYNKQPICYCLLYTSDAADE